MKPKNPFVIRGYAGAEYFCDRQKETAKLISALENDCDVTLIAPRRFGKTGLIHHVFSQLPSEYTGIYLDIYALKDLPSFTKAFASAVLGALDTQVFARDSTKALPWIGSGLGWSRSGYTFKGWSTSSSSSYVSYANAASVRNLASSGGTANLYAVWSSPIVDKQRIK